tara:strand:- start:670 stop:1410 length:741 start_codon:yes stop_codon:yes gene_type:complete
MANIFTQYQITSIRDICCNTYQNIIEQRLSAIATRTMYSTIDNNNISVPKGTWGIPLPANERAKIRGYYLPEPFTSNRNSSGAGATFNTNFPSKCFTCFTLSSTLSQGPVVTFGNCAQDPNKGIYDILINKKGYMFQNTRGTNVTSGPIEYIKNGNREYLLQFGGKSSASLTVNKQLSNMGKGLTPDGRPGRRFGRQSFVAGIPVLLSKSNIYEDTQPILNAPPIGTLGIFNFNRAYIPLCISKTI